MKSSYLCHRAMKKLSSWTQDGLEFSTPRIENPIYDFAGGCYEGRGQGQDNEHTYDPRLPLHGSAANAPSPSSLMRWLSYLLGLSTFSLRRWLLFG